MKQFEPFNESVGLVRREKEWRSGFLRDYIEITTETQRTQSFMK